tara:strand:- start:409 stop:729 length:321 start_codon:yes stop_codon:yes gene_type:complete
MGFHFTDDFEDSLIPEEIIEMMGDTDKQIEFHKNNLITADMDMVAEVMKKFIATLILALDDAQAQGAMPLLSALAESILELRAQVDVLRNELIEKNAPPPDDFEMN